MFIRVRQIIPGNGKSEGRFGESAWKLTDHNYFDRILIAQAQTESLTTLTADRAFNLYDVETLWAGRTK